MTITGVAVLSQPDETDEFDEDDGDHVEPPPPVWPTLSPPGSAGKIAVMRWRLAHGFSAFHPRDLDPEVSGFSRTSPGRLGNGRDRRGVDLTTDEPLDDDTD